MKEKYSNRFGFYKPIAEAIENKDAIYDPTWTPPHNGLYTPTDIAQEWLHSIELIKSSNINLNTNKTLHDTLKSFSKIDQ